MAAALLHDPELVIFDEPCSGLDVASILIHRRMVPRWPARQDDRLQLARTGPGRKGLRRRRDPAQGARGGQQLRRPAARAGASGIARGRVHLPRRGRRRRSSGRRAGRRVGAVKPPRPAWNDGSSAAARDSVQQLLSSATIARDADPAQFAIGPRLSRLRRRSSWPSARSSTTRSCCGRRGLRRACDPGRSTVLHPLRDAGDGARHRAPLGRAVADPTRPRSRGRAAGPAAHAGRRPPGGAMSVGLGLAWRSTPLRPSVQRRVGRAPDGRWIPARRHRAPGHTMSPPRSCSCSLLSFEHSSPPSATPSRPVAVALQIATFVLLVQVSSSCRASCPS